MCGEFGLVLPYFSYFPYSWQHEPGKDENGCTLRFYVLVLSLCNFF